MKYAIIYCPKSGISVKGRMKKSVEEEFQKNNLEYNLYVATKEKPVDTIVTIAIAEGCRTMVIVGGDRSLNLAVNGLMTMPIDIRREVKLGVVPYGTINSFSGFWGLRDASLADCVDYIKKGNSRKIDVGCIHYINKENESCHRYFLNCINLGLSAHITRVRHQTRRVLFSRKLSFIISTLILIFQRSVYKMKFSLNHEIVEGNFMTLCIGNCTGYGQTPSAVPYNGMLDVSAVTITQLSGMIMGFYLLLTGKFLKHKNVQPYRTRKIVFNEVQSIAVSVDGAMINTPKGEFTVDIKEEVLDFIVPYRKN